MERIYARDEKAFDLLVKAHWSPVAAYVGSLLESNEGVEDIVQETFVWIWERRVFWRPEASLRSFICRIARHLSLNQLRWRRLRQRSVGRVREEEIEHRTAHLSLERIERAELRETIERAINTLPRRRREAFCLAYLQELPHREIAEIMGTSIQTVRNQVSAALTDLRRVLAHDLD